MNPIDAAKNIRQNNEKKMKKKRKYSLRVKSSSLLSAILGLRLGRVKKSPKIYI
jgi:hypothetical protein